MVSQVDDRFPSLTVVGSINADLMVNVERHPHPGETLLGAGGEILAGGKGANQAVAAALLGAQVHFVGAVGNDMYAHAATQYLTSAGVDLEHVEQVEATTGLAVITVAEDGENSIIVVPGANNAVDAPFVHRHSSPIKAASILLLQGEIPLDGFAAAVKVASAAGARVVVNLAPVVEVDPHALLEADPLIVNEHEAGLVLAHMGAAKVSQDSAGMVAQLLECGFTSVVLTLGADGALVATQENPLPVAVATPKVNAVDTTGAGDAFTGALVAKLLTGEDLEAAARFAARVGAFAVQSPGAQPSYPSLQNKLP